jgi:hypothetical protein
MSCLNRCVAALLLATSSFGQPLKSLKPPVVLPDGTEFKTWEAETRFTRTYYVDGANPQASDNNPGTKRRPFATINHAVQVLQPGERVVVRAGVYRERIKPARGGTGPTQMISYEAEPGARVVLRGSRVWAEPWTATVIEANGQSQKVWQTKLETRCFEGYNPFALPNVTERQFSGMNWAQSQRGKLPFTLARGLVFQAGRRLQQVSSPEALAAQHGAYWVDRTNQILEARLFGDIPPQNGTVEFTTEETVFAPDETGLGYIRVKGFIVEQVAGPWPFEQVGAISTTRGHHWIIEDCTVRQVNGAGIDVGGQHPRWPLPPQIGFHIVRRNVVTDCGICGICGMGPGRGREFGLLIEDNLVLRNAWHDAERLFETGGIKTHRNVHCLIRRNLVVDTYHGPGIWMDAANRASRCCQNLVLRTHTMHGAIFLELSQAPNLVDNNVVWDTEGNGIYEHDTAGQIFAYNLVGHSTNAAFHLHGKITDRRLGGAEMIYGQHQVLNNLLYQNTQSNVFGGQPCTILGNLSEGFTAAFDPKRLELSLSDIYRLPECQDVPGIGYDFFGKRRKGLKAVAGPFARLPANATRIKLWSGSSLSLVSQANYTGITVIDPILAEQWIATPHTWRSAQVFLYLLDSAIH